MSACAAKYLYCFRNYRERMHNKQADTSGYDAYLMIFENENVSNYGSGNDYSKELFGLRNAINGDLCLLCNGNLKFN